MSAAVSEVKAEPSTAIQKAWAQALSVWDVAVTLSPPETWRRPETGKEKTEEPLAYIDLSTRQVVVNLELLDRMGAMTSLPGVLAHEIGHHVRFPHTLGLSASLQVLEKRLIPGLGQSLTNLFFDLLVNEYVGRTLADQLCAVYQGFQRVPGAKPPQPLFAFYLTVYEELWSREANDLVPVKVERKMEKEYPGFRGDARGFVQTFYALPTIQQQFVYFCSRFIRYVPDPSKLTFVIPLAGDLPAPDADDFDAAVRGHGEQEADEAMEEAKRRGWIEDSGLSAQEQADPLETIRRITEHLPGHGQAELKLALVSKHYKRLVDEHILKLPGQKPPPEPFLPSIPEDWDWGDNPKLIDWTATVLAKGPLAGLQPLKRDQLPDEPSPQEANFPEVEIYLDTSGSMPNPGQSLNTMTLAAQILAASALRKGGKVRGVVYSSGRPLVSEWMSDEETARRFLLNYAGGGTDYPFRVLKAFAKERDDVIRVIISDADFLWNVQGAGHMDALRFGCEHSSLLVAFLAASGESTKPILAPILDQTRFRLALVTSLNDFAKAAADLAEALIGRPEKQR